MQRDEALFIKCFDSAEDGRARVAAHTGFDDPTTPSNAPPRDEYRIKEAGLLSGIECTRGN